MEYCIGVAESQLDTGYSFIISASKCLNLLEGKVADLENCKKLKFY